MKIFSINFNRVYLYEIPRSPKQYQLTMNKFMGNKHYRLSIKYIAKVYCTCQGGKLGLWFDGGEEQRNHSLEGNSALWTISSQQCSNLLDTNGYLAFKLHLKLNYNTNTFQELQHIEMTSVHNRLEPQKMQHHHS